MTLELPIDWLCDCSFLPKRENINLPAEDGLQ
jgi:hypothetical protein